MIIWVTMRDVQVRISTNVFWEFGVLWVLVIFRKGKEA